MSYLDQSKFKACKCGTKVEDEFFTAKQHYSWVGWFFITCMGTTFNPKEIEFICTRSGKEVVFQRIQDPKLIQYFELNKKR
ncbi:MAG: hypothetical protein CME65_12540 [Halobacteriovoraceae bacterium]|nr:hypothetical protein [Halobacteriovoraceae bacterium]